MMGDLGGAQLHSGLASFRTQKADSEIVMVDGTIWDDSFEQDRSWDDFGTTIAGI